MPPKTVEIDEAELAQLRQVQAFTNTALKNPATRGELLRIQKKLDPTAVIPELDAADSVRSEVKAVEDRMEKILLRMEERDKKDQEDRRTLELTARIREGEAMLQANGYTAEGIKAVSDLMVKEGIVSYSVGQAFYEKLNPPSLPADSSRGGRFSGPTDHDIRADDYKGLWESQGNSEDWLEDSLAKVRSEFRN